MIQVLFARLPVEVNLGFDLEPVGQRYNNEVEVFKEEKMVSFWLCQQDQR